MKDVLKFLEDLLEEMEEIDWAISRIVEGEKVVENNKHYLQVDNELYEKQDNLYIRQWTGYCEDDYHGIIYYKIKDNKYLQINYSC